MLPSLEKWQSTMADMVLFHQEQGLAWLWLPTPADWIEGLHALETPEQTSLRALLVMPATPQPAGLVWHAWDTRTDDWSQDMSRMGEWYGHWANAQTVLT